MDVFENLMKSVLGPKGYVKTDVRVFSKDDVSVALLFDRNNQLYMEFKGANFKDGRYFTNDEELHHLLYMISISEDCLILKATPNFKKGEHNQLVNMMDYFINPLTNVSIDSKFVQTKFN